MAVNHLLGSPNQPPEEHNPCLTWARQCNSSWKELSSSTQYKVWPQLKEQNGEPWYLLCGCSYLCRLLVQLLVQCHSELHPEQTTWKPDNLWHHLLRLLKTSPNLYLNSLQYRCLHQVWHRQKFLWRISSCSCHRLPIQCHGFCQLLHSLGVHQHRSAGLHAEPQLGWRKLRRKML